jgi:hypothetical protein
MHDFIMDTQERDRIAESKQRKKKKVIKVVKKNKVNESKESSDTNIKNDASESNQQSEGDDVAETIEVEVEVEVEETEEEEEERNIRENSERIAQELAAAQHEVRRSYTERINSLLTSITH